MLHRMNEKIKTIEVPGIRVFSNKVAQMPEGINLTIGEPDFPTPQKIKDAGATAIANDLTSYSHNAGLLELRKAVSSFFEDTYHFHYDPETEIVITNGASSGIDAIFRSILTEGDEVILPVPIYSGYEPIIHLCGAKAVYLDTTTTNFLPDPEQLEKLISNKTKAIVFNYPSNPTGAVIDKERMDKLVQIIIKHEIFIISDEIYSENTYKGTHVSFGSYSEVREQLFLVHGLSKSHSMTGWRLGFVLGSKKVMDQILKAHLSNSICASLPSQYAGIEALSNCRNVPNEMNKSYIKRRDYVYKRLVDMGLSLAEPKGAFYAFPSIKSTGLTSYEFATKLLNSKQVAVVPGSAFTQYGEGFIRISYANSMENLIKAMDRIEDFVKSLSSALDK
ncbi:aminotransferase class I/II-fold pyridoxal phosphate-dependent enzyme [Sporosarcina sp. PTS2304]|uniref:aminotransferase class I/II-fold pyridoxal phosphate-dependent enzyme n=1 Tax=Sporosarcina sp. PTS2304 TaxID=2283194 RepID=UPI000E0CD903|nr:aminotransferase class I/II-fold pyridoxal phosphate-dependent enzyme [Sporosarcina sp. PTS2304]AXI00198.1 aminotransferase class I/II-fold pyridoxal phosphate-dependent enzyme [Sporosarcina sp. PTS2304]